MLKANNEQLKINSAVLKAVRKISGASFNKKLEGYSLNFSATLSIGVLSFHLNKGEMYCDIFPAYVGAVNNKGAFFQTPIPSTVSDIERFEGDVERALAEVFEFVKGNK